MADEAAPAPDAPVPAEGPAARVFVRDKYGKRYSLPAEQAQKALGQGFSLESAADTQDAEEEKKYGDREVSAGLAGAARGFTAGLSDLALTKTGIVQPSTLKGIKEHNQGASIAGEVAGVGAGLFVPALGEASAAKGIASLGRAAGAVAGEGFARAAITGGVEGGLYGIGNTVSEASLGNTELNAQKLVAGAGMGAALGFAGGVGGELLGMGAQRALKKAGEIAGELPETFGDMAEAKALKGAGFIQSDLTKVSPAQQSRIGRRLLDQDLLKGGKKEDILAAIKADKMGTVDEAASLLKKADEAAPVTEGAALGNDVTQMSGGFDVRKALARVQTDLIEPLKDNPVRMKAASEALSHIETLANGNSNIPFALANQIKNDMGEGLFSSLDNKLKKRLGRQLEGIFNDELKSQVGDVLGDESEAALRAAQSNTADLITAEKASSRAVNREAGNHQFGLTDKIMAAAGIAHGGPMGAVLGVGGATLNKLAREQGDAYAARGLNYLAKAPWFNTAAEGFSNFAKAQLQNGSNVFAEYTPLLANALARGPEDALLTHALLSSKDENYRDTMASTGLDYSEHSGQVAGKAMGLSAIKGQLDAHDSSAEDAIQQALAGGGVRRVGQPARSGLLGDSATGPLKTWNERADALTRLANNPLLLQQRIAAALGPLSGVAPTMAVAVADTAARAVSFLQSVMPQPVDPLQNIPALKRPWAPSDSERAKFERYLTATNEPASVFAGLAHGEVTAEAVKSLQAVYPALYSEWQQKAMAALAAHKGELSMRQRVALSSFVGQPLDSSASPQAIARIQAVYKQPGMGAASADAQKNRPLKPRSEETPAQHLLARGQ